jgi:uncharacterized protein YxjI
MEQLAAANGLVVRQKKEWGEILTDFEQRNKYLVTDPAGSDLFAAVETGGSTLARLFLKNLRPFQMQLMTLNGNPTLELERPFRFYFHELIVADPKRGTLGSIKRRFSILRRVYSVLDASGREKFALYGPLLHPWTFEIRQGDKVVGRIVKKWTGIGKEMLTDADTFGVTFPPGCDTSTKATLLGAVFLIDFVHFEDKSG